MLGLARRYVSHRQMLGYKMTDAGRVAAFAEFMDRVAPGQPLTAARALEWVMRIRTQDHHASRAAQHAARFRALLSRA